jgi:hypothetical protein
MDMIVRCQNNPSTRIYASFDITVFILAAILKLDREKPVPSQKTDISRAAIAIIFPS